MLIRMLRQSFFEGRRRKALAAVTVALSATLITTLFALLVDVGDKMAWELKSYGSNIRVAPKSEAMALVVGGVDYNPLKDRDYLNESDLPNIKDIFWRNNIVGLAPRLTLPVMLETAAGEVASQVTLIGTWFEHVLPLPDEPGYRTGVRTTNPSWQVIGSWPDEVAEESILVGEQLAARLGVNVGDRLLVQPADSPDPSAQELLVAGILAAGGSEDAAVVASLSLAQTLSDLPGQVQWVDVSALTIPENELSSKARRDTEALTAEEYDTWYCTAYVSSIAHQIEEAVVNASARPIWQVAAGEGAIIRRIQVLLLVVSIAAVAAATMGVSSLMSTTVLERSREIGLMKALGAAPWEIHTLFLAEAAIVGLIGGALGLLLGFGLAQAVGWSVFGSGVAIQPIVVPIVLVFSVATALAGSILPARMITALEPVAVLHGRN